MFITQVELFFYGDLTFPVSVLENRGGPVRNRWPNLHGPYTKRPTRHRRGSEGFCPGLEKGNNPHTPDIYRELRCIKIDRVSGEVDGRLYSPKDGEINGNRTGQKHGGGRGVHSTR
jgi:hypothetical protein